MKAKSVGGMGGSKPGVVEASKRNPNNHPDLNPAPDGPYSHCLGYEGDGGVQGDSMVSGKNGMSFEFK